MKRFFDRLSIANKLMAINLVVVTIALSCALTFYLLDERAKQRQWLVDELKVEARILASILDVPLQQNDIEQINRILSSLQKQDSIEHAAIFDVQQKPIALYSRRDIAEPFSSYPPAIARFQEQSADSTSVVFTKQGLILSQLIQHGGSQSILYVHASLAGISESVSNNMLTALLVILIATVMSLLVVQRMVCQVIRPVKKVLQAATEVSQEGNYQVRVKQYSQDELGELAKAFNYMLETIAERDTELSKHQLCLEAEVQERTQELRYANESLENTVVALKQANRAIRISEESKRVAEASAQSKAHFLANMSHELRTPMNGVLGMLSLLNETSLDQEQRDYLNVAYESGHVLLELINNVLDLSKIEQGKLNLETIEFDLRNTIEEAFSILASPAQNKGLELILQWQPEAPLTVVGDPTRFKQLVCNLVANAIKFTAQGYIQIQASLLEDYGTRKRFRFEVQDTGIGVKEEVRELIFEKFSQADSSTTREFGGTGLGLALCKQLTRLMDGEIGVESEYGEGSNFWFEVTFAAANSQPEAEIDSNFEHWLLLEPSKEMGDGFRSYLNGIGYSLEHCESAKQLTSILSGMRGCQFDGVILSLSAGVETVENLLMSPILQRAIAKQRILITGTALQRQRLTADNKLKYGFIQKPLRMQRLKETILSVEAKQLLPVLPMLGQSNVVPLQKHRVLVVEDNQVNQQVAKGRLEKLGYDVAIADNGATAIELFQNQNFDLIFMDCQMPVLDGFQATRRIRQQEQTSSRHIPIIAMTAHALAGDKDQCLQAGMDDYVAKPFKTEELKLVLERWL